MNDAQLKYLINH